MIVGINQTIDLIQSERSESGEELLASERALVAAVLGFGGIAGSLAWMAQVLFVVFLVLFLVSLVTGMRAPRVHWSD